MTYETKIFIRTILSKEAQSWANLNSLRTGKINALHAEYVMGKISKEVHDREVALLEETIAHGNEEYARAVNAIAEFEAVTA